MTDDRDTKALNAAVDVLMQYFDSVQIFCSKNKTDEMTVGQTAGKGSIFARIGQIGLWLSKVESSLAAGDEEPEGGEQDDDDEETN